ncbi:MAG TPA: phosphoribosylaminoimidazolesuccinocarboxamide synthase [Candidatus Thermoplasmatota archaeon]|nr:phosphoribosylaminoimidazolesuccinocarboxamide synthase [Candidatus Thermoplasmatota archaeon]
MTRGKLLYTGKVKQVYDAGPGELEFHFTNNISVFDKIIPTQVPKKGETLNRISEYWFNKVEKELGVPTHFIRRTGPEDMRVRKVEVIRDYNRLSSTSTGHLIPLEVICRHYVAGSLHDRLKAGVIRAKDLGFTTDEVPPVGTKLPRPFVEFTTKLEPVDRELSEGEALAISKLTPLEFQRLKRIVLQVDAIIEREVSKRGLIHVDGKKEFGFNEKRQIMLLDTFGTPDEDRWWDAAEYAKGNIVDVSKEFVRQHYRKTGYHAELMAARKAGATKETEPPIPALPEDVTRQVTDLYVKLYERITGERF